MNQSSTSLDEAVRGSLRPGKFQKFEPNLPEPIESQKISDQLIGLSSNCGRSNSLSERFLNRSVNQAFKNFPDRPGRNWAVRFLGPYLECNA